MPIGTFDTGRLAKYWTCEGSEAAWGAERRGSHRSQGGDVVQAMCLGVPGQNLDLCNEGESFMGSVGFIGVQPKVCFCALPDVPAGEYVLVHVGFGLAKLDEQNALQNIELIKGIGSYEDQFGPGYAKRAKS